MHQFHSFRMPRNQKDQDCNTKQVGTFDVERKASAALLDTSVSLVSMCLKRGDAVHHARQTNEPASPNIKHLSTTSVCMYQEDGVVHHARLDAAQGGQPAIKASWASFAWERDMPPALHNICLEATKGQLVMVVGVVGSGKSSLVAALLGELHARGGTAEVSSSTEHI